MKATITRWSVSPKQDKQDDAEALARYYLELEKTGLSGGGESLRTEHDLPESKKEKQ